MEDLFAMVFRCISQVDGVNRTESQTEEQKEAGALEETDLEKCI